jgi:hypothetical protein
LGQPNRSALATPAIFQELWSPTFSRKGADDTLSFLQQLELRTNSNRSAMAGIR